MTEREKVIKGMEYCIDYAQRVKDLINDVPCEGCPYAALKPIAVGQGDCIDSLFKDALALLKAQEPVKPNEIWYGGVLVYYQCPICTSKLYAVDRYCAHCGRAVKWDD